MFVGYYTYLLVVHINDIFLLVAYAVLIALGLTIFFVMLFTLDPYQRSKLVFKRTIRRILRIVSWTSKLTVICYNIYYLIKFGTTETGQLLLVFSIIIFLTEIILFVFTNIFSHYYQLFIYALQMDYQKVIGEQEKINDKPIGRILLNANGSTNYEEEVIALFVEHEICDIVKRYSEKDDSLVTNRRRLEKALIAYYGDTLYYYQDNDALLKLYNDITQLEVNEKLYPHFTVLKFFLLNEIEKVYFGLSSQYFRFVLCGLSFYRDYQWMHVVDMIYDIIIKGLPSNKDWNKPVNPNSNSGKKSFFSFLKGKDNNDPQNSLEAMLNQVSAIINKSVEENQNNASSTVTGEIESLVSNTIKKKVTGSIKSRIKNIFKKK